MGEVVISHMCPSGLKAKPKFATIIKVFHARQMATIEPEELITKHCG